MELSLEGWIDGVTAIGIVFFGLLLGSYLFYESKKSNVKLIFHLGVPTIFAGLMFLGVSCDFMTIIITNDNLDAPNVLVPLLSYMWFAPVVIFSLYLALELHALKRKWFIAGMFLFTILSIIFEIIIFLDPINSFAIVIPEDPSDVLIDYNVNIVSPAGIILTTIFISLLFILGFGFMYKAIQASNFIRKKYLFLSIGNFSFIISGILEGLAVPGMVLIFIRISYSSSYLLFYFAIRPEHEKAKKKSVKRDVEIEEGLFRLIKRPAQITEEEVTYYREQKVCLICKGKVGGFNNFICTTCNALYCEKCARALVNIENMCWACNSVIDPSKPVIPYVPSKEKIDLEISETSKNNPKDVKDPSHEK